MNHLLIEWRHVDKNGITCKRCSDTGESVQAAYVELIKQLRPRGWEVILKEIRLTARDISESNSLYINGIPLEKVLSDARRSDNYCPSCSDLLGCSTQCRTLERNGQIFEAIPSTMIVEAANNVVENNKKE